MTDCFDRLNFSLGTIKIIRDPQGIKQFQWTEAGSNNPFQNIMIFPGDCKFEKVKQSKDRVYLLEFHQSKTRHFFWMQEKDEEGDAERCKKVHSTLNDIEGDQDMDTSQTPVSSSGPQTRVPQSAQPQNPGASGQPNYENMFSEFFSQENLQKMAHSMRRNSGPDLNSIITSESKNKVLEDEKA
jgi:26S proteasome regulatory subunit N13